MEVHIIVCCLCLPFRSDVCQMYDIIIHIREQPKTSPNRIVLCERLILSYLVLLNQVQYLLYKFLVQVAVSFRKYKTYEILLILIDYLFFLDIIVDMLLMFEQMWIDLIIFCFILHRNWISLNMQIYVRKKNDAYQCVNMILGRNENSCIQI